MKKIYVGNFSFSMTEPELRSLFEPHGIADYNQFVLTERKPRTKKQLEQRLQTILKEIESLAPGT